MPIHSLLTCSGFTETAGSFIASGDCMKSRLGFVILFFIIAIARKWGGEEMGLNFSFLFGLVGSLVPYFIVVTLFGSFKIALIVGLLGGLVGGYLLGAVFGEGEGGGYE